MVTMRILNYHMKSNILWIVLPAILALTSCKKNADLSVQDPLKLKVDIIGEWKPFKVITETLVNNQIVKRADSSEFVPSYTLGYHIEKDFLVTNEKKSTYKLSKDGQKLFLEYNIFGYEQKVPVVSLDARELVLQRIEMIGEIKKTETVYYKK